MSATLLPGAVDPRRGSDTSPRVASKPKPSPRKSPGAIGASNLLPALKKSESSPSVLRKTSMSMTSPAAFRGGGPGRYGMGLDRLGPTLSSRGGEQKLGGQEPSPSHSRSAASLAATATTWKEMEAGEPKLKISEEMKSPALSRRSTRLTTSPLESRSRSFLSTSGSSFAWQSGSKEGLLKASTDAGRSQEADNEASLERSQKLMDSLSTLRRSCDPRTHAIAEEEGNISEWLEAGRSMRSLKSARSPSPRNNDVEARREARNAHEFSRTDTFGTTADHWIEELPVLQAALFDLHDDSESLVKARATMEALQEPIIEAGGTRHASAVMAAKADQVLKKKGELLQKAEARSAAFERVHAAAAELNEELRETDAVTPPELQGTRAFLATLLHKDGRPWDADKSDFDVFVANLGLDRQHQAILRIKQLQAEAVDWWSKSVIEEVELETTTRHLHRMIRVLKDISEGDEMPSLKQGGPHLNARMASICLLAAEELKAQDTEELALADKPVPEMARKYADRILEDLQLAKALGCSPEHPKMLQAKGIAVQFRQEEKDRHAKLVLVGARERKERDAEAAAQAQAEGRVPEVGPAVVDADAIEADVDRVVEQWGVAPTNVDLKEAKQIAKALRDEDGHRRRLQGRERRSKETARG